VEQEVDCQCGEPGCGTCPGLVDIAGPDYSITKTEVSRDQYAAFVAVSHDMNIQVTECLANDSYIPTFSWPASPGDGDQPVIGVDYCDARAYCAWTGRELCGARTGGAHDWDDHANASISAWYDACSNGGTQLYPYGTTYDPNACNGTDLGLGGFVDVGTLATCDGSITGLRDMAGNVWEWTNACGDVGSGNEGNCIRRGGGRFSTADTMRCNLRSARDVLYKDSSTGIRCCYVP
jgi:formylglycine-generating enzyme required for sulfatase activity